MTTQVWTDERKALALAEAKRWLGTPHHDRIAKIGVGVDCINYVNEILIAAGVIERREIGGYNTAVGLKVASYAMKRAVKACVECEEIPPTEQQQFGDVLIFKEGKFSGHGGFFADGFIFHALGGNVVTKSDFVEWQRQIHCMLRITNTGLKAEPSFAKLL